MFVMVYKGVTITVNNGKFNWIKGWVPQENDSLRQAKYNITRWLKS